ncbi:hypothetical protein WUBG_04882, partial [Wuchereria bancrofti]
TEDKDIAENADNVLGPTLKKQSFIDSDVNSGADSIPMPIIQEKVNSSSQKDYCDEVEKTELTMNVVLRQPPQYNETLEAFHTQNKLQIPYHRSNPNSNIKPRWITVADVTPSGTTVSCPLGTSTHLTYSEPKLHYQMYTRSGSPLASMPTTSYQLPAVGSSPRPSPSYTPPIIRTGASSGLFQKRHGQRVPYATAVRGISRVQSMPAHNSQHYVDDDEFAIATAAASIKHSQSAPGTRLSVYTKQPPPYEHAILQQARARYAQKGVVMCQTHPNSAPKDFLSQKHLCTSDQEEMTLNSRIRQYPMMRALWQEHQQGSCVQLATNANSTSITRLDVPSISNPILSSFNAVLDDATTADSQLQRPSSCQEVSSSVLVTTSSHLTSTTYNSRPTAVYATRPSTSWTPVYHRELYVPDLSPPSCCYYSPFAAGRNQM